MIVSVVEPMEEESMTYTKEQPKSLNIRMIYRSPCLPLVLLTKIMPRITDNCFKYMS